MIETIITLILYIINIIKLQQRVRSSPGTTMTATVTSKGKQKKKTIKKCLQRQQSTVRWKHRFNENDKNRDKATSATVATTVVAVKKDSLYGGGGSCNKNSNCSLIVA